MGVIYVRPNLINGKKYVGQATNLKTRQNRWNCLSEKYAGTLINRARAKYGIEAFGFAILNECDDKEVDYWEKYYIKELNTKVPNGYNMTDGGEGMTGYTHSEETIKKMSEIQKGKNNSFYGKHHTDEAKKKISDANKGEKNYIYGKHLSEETKIKISDAKKGIILSEETKRKISESNKGEKNHMYGKHHTDEAKKKISDANKNGKWSKIVIQIDISTNEVIAEFQSTREIERQFGFLHSNISKCCNGKQKTCGGYIWKYKEESVA